MLLLLLLLLLFHLLSLLGSLAYSHVTWFASSFGAEIIQSNNLTTDLWRHPSSERRWRRRKRHNNSNIQCAGVTYIETYGSLINWLLCRPPGTERWLMEGLEIPLVCRFLCSLQWVRQRGEPGGGSESDSLLILIKCLASLRRRTFGWPLQTRSFLLLLLISRWWWWTQSNLS